MPLLMRACGIGPSALTAFEARVRQLQRLGLLRDEGVRAAGRLDYGILELAALATAMRLMAAFMVPSLAARHVTERWGTLVPALLAGARTALPKDYVARRPLEEGTIIVIQGSALADMGQRGQHGERYVGDIGDAVVSDRTALSAAMKSLGGAAILLDTATYMPAIVNGFAQATMATVSELSHELDRLRFSE
ncbi:hypothetical protein [Sphingomonas sp. BAUL-RG-20F-R05-02]|uniref:hypothetical protein n=1 Tax=Sphingomonas sp. BAUL-RG-20F-R05-02 TaxID=2914830 RepID=UPI001F55D79E|nr:hypothetical protein [Sphingomonas sp. BAUL-RG-20F-R05-02]